MVACSGPYGYWDSGRQCYVGANETMVLTVGQANRANGEVLLSCTSPSGQEMFTFWGSPSQASGAPPPPPDPAVLARQAVASMGLAPVEIGMFPKPTSQQADALGYVGWHQWMWVENRRANTWGPISATASLDGYSVTATATVDRVVWSMGDGNSVTCQAGTPWRGSSENVPSPDCGHVYERDGEYTVTATSYWTVTWSGIGETGSFAMDFDASENHTVAEVQVLNVPARSR